VVTKRDRSRIAGDQAPVDVCGDRSAGAGGAGARKGLAPDVEELAERERALERRLDVDDP
jgi:hypothetical protein